MLELNRSAEVSLHAQAADMEFTLERHGADNWSMVIEGVSDVGLAVGVAAPISQVTWCSL